MNVDDIINKALDRVNRIKGGNKPYKCTCTSDKLNRAYCEYCRNEAIRKISGMGGK